MSLPDLLSALDRQATEELAADERAAEREAADIRAAATRDAERMFAQAVGAAETKAEAAAAQAVAAARAAAAQDVRAAREVALRQVHDAALVALGGVRHRPDGDAVLADCLTEALPRVPAADLIAVDPRDVESAHRLAGDRHLSVVADLDTCGGLIVRGGGRYADSTFETRLAGAWPLLRGRLAAGWVEQDR